MSQLSPTYAPSLYRKIDIGGIDFYSPLVIGVGLIRKVDACNRELFIKHNPEKPTPTDDEVSDWAQAQVESNNSTGIDLMMVFAEILLRPGTHGKSVREVEDFITTVLLRELTSFFMASAFGQVSGYDDYKSRLLEPNPNQEAQVLNTNATSPSNTSETSTNT